MTGCSELLHAGIHAGYTDRLPDDCLQIWVAHMGTVRPMLRRGLE